LKYRVVLNIFIALIEEAYVNSRMEQKSHWVFDYIRYSDKKNQKEILEKSILEENEKENNNQNVKIKKDHDSKYDTHPVLSKKNTKIEKDVTNGRYFSVKESPFSINIESQKNSYQPKSLVLRGNERAYEKELNSLSYKRNFEILSSHREDKLFKLEDKQFNINNSLKPNKMNLYELSNYQDNSFTNNNLISPINNRLTPHSNLKKKNIFNNNLKNIQENKEITKNIENIYKKSDKQLLKINTLESPAIKKRVNFAQEIPKDYNRRISVEEVEIISEERNQLRLNKSNLHTTLKKDNINKIDKNKIPKELDYLKIEVEKEFENIFEDLNLIDKHSKKTLNKLPSYMIDDLRLMILDLTNSIDQKKKKIEEELNK
jgi:hypothetical protein